MFTIFYQLVTDRYLQTNRVNINVVLGNFNMQDGRTHTNSTVEEVLTSIYSRKKCEVSWMKTLSQH